ncbi:MAG: hypothetical protein HOO19_14390 [Rhodospirillaceae bacterium]|jgi:hypothetical protein|nr:hypothetical protein [Rhodospirillaceae bacterium]MBT4672592.1 hypothetical protein [Rhodospirillaceae bacterium]MBT4720578.1 hypothetical protein [Rhodospirillaceae bacterium]MBT4750519.1 hypothetical protein [Rhodospirillaceae bacterium]MBT5177954.1 hypothetical protein [Rhodospirillaceae bacterium]
MNTVFGLSRLAPPGWNQDGTAIPPTLIELTAKRWKGLLLVGYAFLIAGFGLIGLQLWNGLYGPLFNGQLGLEQSPVAMLGEVVTGAAGIVGAIILAFALAVLIYARFMAWWRHG